MTLITKIGKIKSKEDQIIEKKIILYYMIIWLVHIKNTL